MCRYIVFLILLNTYYCSFGHPVLQNATRVLVQSPLMTLATDCKNSFLTDLIRSNVKHCSDPVPPDSQPELECLMFYEVSTRLCTEVHPPGIDLKELYTKKISNTEDVETLCDNAKTWKLSNLEQYPKQKVLLEKVFKNKRACLKLCSVDDIFNVDSNFYCKLFEWGFDLIKSQDPTTTQHENSQVNSTQQNVSLQNVTLTSSLVKTENVTISKNDNELNAVKSVETDITKTGMSGQAPTNNQASDSSSNIPKEIQNVEQKTSQQLPAPIQSIKTESDKPSAVAEEPPKQDNVDNVESEMPKQKEEIKPVIDKKVKQNAELDDNMESEFGNDAEQDEDPLADQDAENGNDPIVESDPKLDVEKTKASEKKIESITSLQDTVQRETGLFPNPIQESFAEDDDHFFPFFLTAIIIVVLLYILYHNKTKFTKVILGLIVEGRQTDRRRNSRGHSYRRLDTLEQAMSTNTAAPPSKIIY